MNVASSAGGDGGKFSSCSCFSTSSSMKLFRFASAKTDVRHIGFVRRRDPNVDDLARIPRGDRPAAVADDFDSTVLVDRGHGLVRRRELGPRVTSRTLPSLYLARTTIVCWSPGRSMTSGGNTSSC